MRPMKGLPFLTAIATLCISAQSSSAAPTGAPSHSISSDEHLHSKGSKYQSAASKVLYCSQAHTAQILERLNAGSAICNLEPASPKSCRDSDICLPVFNFTNWACNNASQSLVQVPCTALCQPRILEPTLAQLSRDGKSAAVSLSSRAAPLAGVPCTDVIDVTTAAWLDSGGSTVTSSLCSTTPDGMILLIRPPPGVILTAGFTLTLSTHGSKLVSAVNRLRAFSGSVKVVSSVASTAEVQEGITSESSRRRLYDNRILGEAPGSTVGGAASSGISDGGTADAYIVTASGAVVSATMYGIRLSLEYISDGSLGAKLSSSLPPLTKILYGSGVTKLRCDSTVPSTMAVAPAAVEGSGACAVSGSLDGTTSYLEVRIPAPGLNPAENFGCLSYNSTINSLRAVSGNIVGLPNTDTVAVAAMAQPPALYDNATGRVICRLTSVVGSYLIAQQQKAAVGTSSSNSSSGSEGNSQQGHTDRIVGLVVACVVGGIMVIPLTLLAATFCVMRSKRLREEVVQLQGGKPQPQEGQTRGTVSYIP